MASPTTGLSLARLCCLVTALCSFPALVLANTLEEETAIQLDQLRGITTDQSGNAVDRYNKQMDDMWQFFSTNKTQVLPVLREALKKEMVSPQPNDMVLLDIGYFVFGNDDDAGKAVALDALFKLNPNARSLQQMTRNCSSSPTLPHADRMRGC